MRQITAIIAALTILIAPMSAQADGHGVPIVVVDTPPPVGSGNSGYILLGVMVALVLALDS